LLISFFSRGGRIHRLREFLVALPRRVFGARAVDVALAATKWLEAPALWAVPIGYAALILACEYFFVKHAFPRLCAPAATTTAATASGLLFVAMCIAMALPLATFAAAIFVDAGKLTKTNVSAALACYPFDGIIFPEGRAECRTCRLPRPARSKHCSTCNACILCADHHCLWLNNCVGQGNYCWFIAFLVANLLMLWYGLMLIVGIFRAERLVQQQQQQKMSAAATGSWVGLPSWSDLLLGRNGDDGLRILFCLALLCATMSILVAAFLAQHVRYIYLGVTTNESAKWEDVQYALADGELFRYADPAADGINNNNSNNNSSSGHAGRQLYTPQIVVQITEAGTFNRRLTPTEAAAVRTQGLRLVPVHNITEIENIYDQGFLANLRHRLFAAPV
jgi:palmitoyltransferase